MGKGCKETDIKEEGRMSNEYPLYPDLKEEAAEEAQQIMNSFKEKMLKLCKETLSEIYCDVVMYIESDSWTNFRTQLMNGFAEYGNRKLQGEYDFAKIREKIFKEHRDEIIKECQEDIVKENESLKRQIKTLYEMRR